MSQQPFGERKRFETTHWSLVRRAQANDPVALEDLLRRYQKPLRAHLVFQKGLDPDDADDVLQDFLVDKIVAKGLLALVREDKGKFRTFLLTVLDRFVIDHIRHKHAKKRAAERAENLDQQWWVAQGEGPSADVFEVSWAQATLARALKQMQDECEQRNRGQTWKLFEYRVLRPFLSSEPATPFERLAPELGFSTAKQASNALKTATRHFARVVRSVVADSLIDESEIEDEIAALRTILSSPHALDAMSLINQLGIQDDRPAHSSDLENAAPQAMASLLELTNDASHALGPVEFEETMRTLAQTPLASLIGKPLSNGGASSNDAKSDAIDEADDVGNDAVINVGSGTLDDLFCHPMPPLALLEQTKRFARASLDGESDHISSDIALVLYFWSIAAAIACHGRRITKSRDADLRSGFGVALTRSWIPAAVRERLQAGLDALSD